MYKIYSVNEGEFPNVCFCWSPWYWRIAFCIRPYAFDFGQWGWRWFGRRWRTMSRQELAASRREGYPFI